MNFELSGLLSRFAFFERVISGLLNSVFFLFRKFNITFYSRRKIAVVIVLHKLGDTVFTIPAIKLIQKNVDIPLIVVCYEESKKIYDLVLMDVEYQTFSTADFIFNERLSKFSTNKKFKSLKPTLIFDLTGVMTSASLLYNSSAKEIVGFNRQYFRSIYTHFFDNYQDISQINQNKIQHSIDIYLNAISSYIKLKNNEIENEYPLNYTSGNSISIFPFAGWPEKEWGLNNFIRLATYFCNNQDVRLIVPAGSIKKDILYSINKNIRVVESNSIDKMIHEISTSGIVIGNDSGPVQIASLIGIPTFSIYGPTNPKYHMPQGKHHQYIQKIINCSPKENERLCFTNGGREGCPSNECLRILKAEEVYTKLETFIDNLDRMKLAYLNVSQ